jgi:hypothetical protein
MKREQIQAPKGVSEYVPPRSASFEWIRDQLIGPAKSAGYQLMELPVFEDTNLFSRGVGESTDVVSKEMYTFEDRGRDSTELFGGEELEYLKAIGVSAHDFSWSGNTWQVEDVEFAS